jgi:hypothetical protein
MPAKKTVTCRECGEPFTLEPRKPGLVDECPRCLAARGSFVDPLAGCSDELRKLDRPEKPQEFRFNMHSPLRT